MGTLSLGSPGARIDLSQGDGGWWLGQILQTVWVVEELAGTGPSLALLAVEEAGTADYF